MTHRNDSLPIERSVIDQHQERRKDPVLEVLVVSSALAVLILGVLMVVIVGSAEAATEVLR